MSVGIYDRWHKTHPRPGDKPCRCSRGKNKLYPSSDHEQGLRWQVRYTDDQGKSKRRNFAELRSSNPEVPDHPELHAEAFAARVKSELDSGSYLDPALGNITLRAYGMKWRAARPKGDANTLRGLDNRLVYICNPIDGDRRKGERKGAHSPIADLTLKHLAQRPSLAQQWIKWLEDLGLTERVITAIVGTASSIYTAAMDDGIVTRNPFRARSLDKPKPGRSLVTPWTLKQIQACAAEIAAYHDRSEFIPYLGAGTGLRQGEIFGFAEEDIDREQQIIRVRRQVKMVSGQLVFALPKRGKIRDVPLSDALEVRLGEQIRRHPPVEIVLPWDKPDGKPHKAQLLFVTAGGTPWWSNNFNDQLWAHGRHAAGALPGRENGMHVLRHTFASACLASGVDVRTLAEYLGHTDPGFTLRFYAHLMPSAAGRTRKALDAFFSASDKNAPEVPPGGNT